MKPLALTFFAALFLSACATYYYQPAATQPGQNEAEYTQGLPGLRSQQYGADLTAGLSAKGENDLSLQVYIYNDSDSAYTFNPEDVRVSGYDEFGHMKPLRVFGAAQYIKWKRNRDILIGTAVVVGTVALVLIVSEVSKDKKKSSGKKDKNYSREHSGWHVDPYFDPVGWIDFSFQVSSAMIQASAAPPSREPVIPDDGLLRTQTLYPGEAVQGTIKVRGMANFTQRVLVEIPVNGAYHKFAFENRQPFR